MKTKETIQDFIERCKKIEEDNFNRVVSLDGISSPSFLQNCIEKRKQRKIEKEEKRKQKKIKSYLKTTIFEAAKQGDVEAAKWLIENGADINAKNNNDYTALINAAINGYTAIVELLIENGADINAKNNNGNTALTLAAYNGHTDIVKYLIENGADINAKNNYGFTALTLADRYNETKIVEIINYYNNKAKLENENN